VARVSLEHNPVAALGRLFLEPVRTMGRMAVMFGRSLIMVFTFPWQFMRVMEQIYFIGAKSVFVILLTGAFTGMVLGLQGYYSLSRYGSEAVLGAAVGLALVREMGPVLTAFMVIARAGSAMAAELGSMRISEQIDALKTMEINPVKFLVSPRLLAALISFPLLTAMFNVIGVLGGYLTGSVLMGQAAGVFFSSVESGVETADIAGGLFKSIVFAALVITICCFRGYYAHETAGGFGSKAVGYATTSAVVISCVLVLAADYIITSFLL